MNEVFECPREDNKCSFCLELASVAFLAAVKESDSFVIRENAKLLQENARIKPVLEEREPLTDFSCEERQKRAQLVGRHMGEAQAEHGES